MSEPKPLSIFTQLEQGVDHLELWSISPEGRSERLIVHRSHDKGEDILVAVGCLGELSRPELIVQLFIARRGVEGGNPHLYGATHIAKVRMPNRDAIKLTKQLSNHMHSTAHVVENVMSYKPTLNDITYGYSLANRETFTIACNKYNALIFGLEPGDARFTLAKFGRSHKEHEPGLMLMRFAFTDETQTDFDIELSVPSSEIDRLSTELRTFIKNQKRRAKRRTERRAKREVERQANPKAEAVTL